MTDEGQIGAPPRIDALLVADPLDSPIAAVFGNSGIAVGDPVGLLLVWLVGPLAAAVAGFGFAVAAARGVDGSGLWMGAATYLLAVCLIAGPIWAATLRLTPGGLARGGPAIRSYPLLPIVILSACVLLGWAVVTAMIGAIGEVPVD